MTCARTYVQCWVFSKDELIFCQTGVCKYTNLTSNKEGHGCVLSCICINTIVSYACEPSGSCSIALMSTWTRTHAEKTQCLRQQLFKTPLNQHIMTKGVCSGSADSHIFYYVTSLESLRLAFSESVSVFIWATEEWTENFLSLITAQDRNGQNTHFLTSKAWSQEVKSCLIRAC